MDVGKTFDEAVHLRLFGLGQFGNLDLKLVCDKKQWMIDKVYFCLWLNTGTLAVCFIR